MSQSKFHSIIETVINVGSGYIIAVGTQIYIFPLYGLYVPMTQNFQMAGIFTGISLIRSYIVRRLFNKI